MLFFYIKYFNLQKLNLVKGSTLNNPIGLEKQEYSQRKQPYPPTHLQLRKETTSRTKVYKTWNLLTYH